MKLFISDDSELDRQLYKYLQRSDETELIASGRKIFSFRNFIKKDMQREVYTHVLIDMSVINEDIHTFSDLLEQYQMIYAAEIIIFCSDLSADTVKPLLNAGITNIICKSDNENIYEDISQALTDGIDPLKWIRLFPDDTNELKKKRSGHKVLLISLIGAVLVIVTFLVLLIILSPDKSRSDKPKVQTYLSKTTPDTSAAAETITAAEITTAAETTVTTSVSSTKITTTTTPAVTKKTTTPKKTATVTTTGTKAASKTTAASKSKTVTSSATTSTRKKSLSTTTSKKVTTTKAATSSKVTTTKAKPKTTTAATTVLPPIPLRGLSLKTSAPDNTVTIKVGETTRIEPVFTPEQATNKKVYFSSNREDRAIVDSSGIVIGRSPGAAIIQCRSDDGGLTAACMIIVKE